MKKLLLIAALIGLLAACRNPAEGPPDEPVNPVNPVNPGQETVIVFDNTQGICNVVVYNDDQRRDEYKIAEIPAGARSREFEWAPGTSVVFYFTYRVNLKGISGFTLSYVPAIGKDRTVVPIDADTKTNIVIPKLDETLSVPDALLSNNSYILIQNNSSYSFQLLRGDGIVPPDNLSNSLVISGERAQYTINPGTASRYQLLEVSGKYIPFPGSLLSFEAGCVYSFVFNNGALSLAAEVEMKLENVAGVSPNKPVPQAPGAPAVTAFDGYLTVRWAAVEGAESYDVYYSKTQSPPALPERTVYTTITAFTGLTNETPYYVWVKAVNENGASDFSPRTRGIPWSANKIPAVPGMPVIIPGVNQLTVNWEETGGASSYEVYISTTSTPPSAAAVTTEKTSAAITRLGNGNILENDGIYYIWVRAVNSAGRSGYSPFVLGTPRTPTVAPATPPRPVLVAGNRELSASWQAVELAAAYEVWVGTSDDSAQAQKFGGDITGGITETVITGLVNEQTYYVWIKAKNVVGTSGFSLSASGTPMSTPGDLTVSAANQQITISWAAVSGVTSYEIYYSTTTTIPASPVYTVTELSRTFTGLTNGTMYYFWVKAVHVNGTSNASPMANGKPLGTPEIPTITPSHKQLLVTWTAVAGADEYEVYYGTDTPTTLAATTSETTTIITELNNGTTYYVRLKAKNANGISDYGPSVSNVPNVSPGLYRSNEKIGDQNLSAALSYIAFSAVDGDDFCIVLGTDESISPTFLYYSDKTVGITLMGSGSERTITLNSSGSLFTIYTGVTLTLDENITLMGRNTNTASLILISGELIINDGAKIIGNTSSNDGGGISVDSNGTLSMNGGEISGNTSSIHGGGISVNSGTFSMHGGTINGNTSSSGGGGISVSGSGTVTMNGGTISGNTANGSGGGGIWSNGGTVTMHGGAISGNTAVRGGGIFVSNSGTITMNGGTINENISNYRGGGVEVIVGGTFTMHGGIISGNTTATEDGGGIFIDWSATLKKIPSGDGQNSGIIYGSEETGVDVGGTPLKNTASNNRGHAVGVYTNTSSWWWRNTTAGQTDHIDTTTGTGLSASGEPPYGE